MEEEREEQKEEVKKRREKEEEYFLLYYNHWFQASDGGATPQLTYCVSIGKLLYSLMVRVADRFDINYYNKETERWELLSSCFFFTDACFEIRPDGSFYRLPGLRVSGSVDILDDPFYTIRSCQSLTNEQKDPNFAVAIAAFKEATRDGAPNDDRLRDVRERMRVIRTTAEVFKKEFASSSKRPDGGTGGLAEAEDADSKTTRGKYEKIVGNLIFLSAAEVAAGERKKLITIAEIVVEIKKTDIFKDQKVPKDNSIKKGVRRTKAWITRRKTLAEARRESGMGSAYDKRQVGGKRRNKKNMDPYVDVNNEG